MPRALVVTLSLLLLATGALLCWPTVRAYLVMHRVQGEIMEVHTSPAPDGLRVSVCYRFPLPGSTPERRALQYAWGLGDQYYRRVDDPVVPAAEVDDLVAGLLALDKEGRRPREVFFQANDPEGTAFILCEAAGDPRRRLRLGILLAAFGLCWSFTAFRRS